MSDESSLPLYNRPSFQAKRERHARRMAVLGAVQIVAVLVLVIVKFHMAFCR